MRQHSNPRFQKLPHFLAVWFAICVSQQALLACLQKVLAPRIIRVRMDAFSIFLARRAADLFDRGPHTLTLTLEAPYGTA